MRLGSWQLFVRSGARRYADVGPYSSSSPSCSYAPTFTSAGLPLQVRRSALTTRCLVGAISCSISESLSEPPGESKSSWSSRSPLSSCSNFVTGDRCGDSDEPADLAGSETELDRCPWRRELDNSASSSFTRASRLLMWFTNDSKCCCVRAFFAVSLPQVHWFHSYMQ